jgi:2'-5' RNA ligase
MPRLFVALDIPADIKEDIANICHGVPYAKWVEVGQMHLTLQFLGAVEGGRYREVVEVLHAVEMPAFSFEIKGVGHFPPRKDPRVLWVGIDKSDTVMQLAGAIERALRSIGVALENRRFHPHVTVARLRERTPLADIAGFLAAHALFRPARPVPASAFHLYSSVLSRDGAVHSKEETFKLEPDRGDDRSGR